MNIALRDLINEGFSVSVENGRLVIMDPLGKKPDFSKEQKWELTLQVVKLLNSDAYLYESFSRDAYRSGKSPGIRIKYNSVLTNKEAVAFYNAEIHRAKNTVHGKAGERLPGKQFRVRKNHDFYKLWVKLDLKLPPRLSSFHDYMGKLKEVLIVGQTKKTGVGIKIRNKTIKALEITNKEIVTALERDSYPDKDQTLSIQLTNNSHTNNPDKDLQKLYENQCFKSELSACVENHDISNQEGELVRDKDCNSLNDDKALDDSFIDDFIADHCW
ncbi:hypothetical protein [Kangiella sp. TOML190]|uniref:hypothetical protein n=1 Tax=Kangiella sp. TOML190 TaxID=2931351 RepID=UPI002040C630|nr:hypothetical protein [Kangiella sp. TOML190]